MESCEYMSSLEGEPEKNTFSKFTPFKKASRFEMCLFKQPAGGESRSCKKTCGCIDIYGEKKQPFGSFDLIRKSQSKLSVTISKLTKYDIMLILYCQRGQQSRVCLKLSVCSLTLNYRTLTRRCCKSQLCPSFTYSLSATINLQLL